MISVSEIKAVDNKFSRYLRETSDKQPQEPLSHKRAESVVWPEFAVQCNGLEY
jgi:apolipoprotein N-acyltransferase